MKLLKYSTRINRIGHYPQLQYDRSELQNTSNKLVSEFIKKPLLANANLMPAESFPKSKLTNFMSASFTSGPFQHIIDDHVLNVISDFHGVQYSTAKIRVKFKKQEYSYWFLNLEEKLATMPINFKNHKGVFMKGSRFGEVISIHSQDEYAYNDGLSPVNLPVDEDLVGGKHFFVMPVINRLILSDQLSDAIAEKKLTGISLYDIGEDIDISDFGFGKLKPYYEG